MNLYIMFNEESGCVENVYHSKEDAIKAWRDLKNDCPDCQFVPGRDDFKTSWWCGYDDETYFSLFAVEVPESDRSTSETSNKSALPARNKYVLTDQSNENYYVNLTPDQINFFNWCSDNNIYPCDSELVSAEENFEEV